MAENRPTTSSSDDHCRVDKELGPASPKSPRLLEQETDVTLTEAEAVAKQQTNCFRRLSGAALYKSTFQTSWTKKWHEQKLRSSRKSLLS